MLLSRLEVLIPSKTDPLIFMNCRYFFLHRCVFCQENTKVKHTYLYIFYYLYICCFFAYFFAIQYLLLLVYLYIFCCLYIFLLLEYLWYKLDIFWDSYFFWRNVFYLYICFICVFNVCWQKSNLMKNKRRVSGQDT